MDYTPFEYELIKNIYNIDLLDTLKKYTLSFPFVINLPGLKTEKTGQIPNTGLHLAY